MTDADSGTVTVISALEDDLPPLPHAIMSEPQPPIAERIEIGTFIDYNRVQLGILTDLDKVSRFARELKLEATAELTDEMRLRLSVQRFTIAVVGEFKRGKSTFINALLGAEALPADVLPCSATLNRVTFGLKPKVRVEFRDGRSQDIEFERLSEYVTKLSTESERVAASIKQAVVEYPTNYCANRVDVIDTPGLNDDQSMTEVTLSVLPHTDAAILVISGLAPFSEFERDFLESKLLTADLGRVIFVVNNIDLFRRPEDVDRVVHHVEERIKAYVLDRAAAQYGVDSEAYQIYVRKIGRPRVFGLSAMQALQGKLTGDLHLQTISRFDVFEQELQRFLTEKLGASRLQAPLSRLVSVAREIDHAIALDEGALQLAEADFERAQQESTANIESLRARKRSELEEISRRAQEVRTEILPVLAALPQEMLITAERSVDEATIEPKELDDIEKLQDRLGRLVARETRRTADVKAEQITQIVQRAVLDEATRVSDFVGLVNQVPAALAENFKVLRGEGDLAHGSSGQAAAAAAIALFTGFGGIYTGFRDAGLKGAAVGAATSFGTLFLGGAVVGGILSLPITLPVVIVLGLLSILPSRWAVRRAFPEQRVERFRERYKDALREKLREQLAQVDLRASVGDQILATFEELRERVERETDAVLRDAETQLTGLRARYERQSAIGEGRYRELEEIRSEIRRIAESATRLSHSLVEAMEI
jgi:predicted GTPase